MPEPDEEHPCHRVMALDAANRAVQFLESGQATGAYILLTNEDGVILCDNLISADKNPIAQAALMLSESGERLKEIWLLVRGMTSPRSPT